MLLKCQINQKQLKQPVGWKSFPRRKKTSAKSHKDFKIRAIAATRSKTYQKQNRSCACLSKNSWTRVLQTSQVRQ